MTDLLWSLDDARCCETAAAGGKASWLARARRAGLPVLDGFVVPAAAAEESLAVGAAALAGRGSGGARRAVMAHPLHAALVAELDASVASLPRTLIVRSSADVEASGEWAGAFSTFADVGRDEVGVAVRGCWSSVYGVDVLARAERARRPAAGISMAVLVQPYVAPDLSGLARVIDGDEVQIDVVQGSGAALMRGWAEGQRAVVHGSGEVNLSPHSLLDEQTARRVAGLGRRAWQCFGHTVIEWLLADDELVLVQTQRGSAPKEPQPPVIDLEPFGDESRVDQLARDALTRRSWEDSRRWEPFLAAVAQVRGNTVSATPASAGIGAGRARVVLDPLQSPAERGPREIIVSRLPTPALAPLLWDAAGLVTTHGSAAAHLIEVARSLGVPAVVACDLPPLPGLDGVLLAVDGSRGFVSYHDVDGERA